ncbi:aspartic endopeptidase [Aureococcus anophagefferens]|uniref:Aspartic endopeptidase n=1 Tax=Aureococcus anophagefferens TaxID=44056 RepID=A0ABR1G4R2_AURAN
MTLNLRVVALSCSPRGGAAAACRGAAAVLSQRAAMKAEAAATLAVVCLQASTLVVQLPVSFNVLCTACGVVVVGAARSLEPLRSGAPAAAGGPPARRSDDAVTLSAGDASGSGFVAARAAAHRCWRSCGGADVADLRFSAPRAACGAASAALLGAYAASKHYALNNLVAASLAVGGLELVSVGAFRNAAIMLGGLFFYDVWWVFGTDVMVTVAKGVDGPIKLLFPRPPGGGDGGPAFSMLGLGDVVVPGLFLALLLRFDAARAAAPRDAALGDFPAPYFAAGVASYAAGLGATLAVMYAFDAAQPALLYLVPATLAAALATAALRGELRALAAFSEEEDDDGAAPAPAASKAD